MARPGFQGRIKTRFSADGRLRPSISISCTRTDLTRLRRLSMQQLRQSRCLYQPLVDAFPGRADSDQHGPPRWPMRGPGENQMAVAMEPLIDKAAKELGLDLLDIRRINAADNDAKYYCQPGARHERLSARGAGQGAAMAAWETMHARSGQRNGSKVRGVGSVRRFHPAGRDGYDGSCD